MKFWKCFALIYCSLLLVACGENAADISAKKAAAEVKKADAEVKKAEDERKKIEAAAKEIEEEVKQGVRSSLKDPDSAKFGTLNRQQVNGRRSESRIVGLIFAK
jgi:Skp family chaperone for outer membrane proteins